MRRHGLALVLVVATVAAAAALVAARAGRGEVEVRRTEPAVVLPSLVTPGAAYTRAPAPPAAVAASLHVTGLGGDDTVLGSLRGRRATVIAFWASTCPPCARELPDLQAVAGRLEEQGVAVLLVNYREDAGTAGSFLRGHGVRLSTWLDRDGSAHDGLGLEGVPTTAVLGPDGGVALRLEGAAEVEALPQRLADMGISAQ